MDNNNDESATQKSQRKSSNTSQSSSLFTQGRIKYIGTNNQSNLTFNEEISSKSNNIMLTKRRPLILKRSGRSSWPIMKKANTNNLNDTDVNGRQRGSADNAELLDYKYNASSSRRNSFLYRTDSCKSKFRNRHNSTKSNISFNDHLIEETEEVVITPYAQILLTLKFVKDRLDAIFHDKRKSCDATVGFGLETQTVAMETLSNLEWCLFQLENLQTRRSVSNLATDKFKRLLSQELIQQSSTNHFASHTISITNHNQSNQNICQYICQTFTEDNEDVDIDDLTDEKNLVAMVNDLVAMEHSSKPRFSFNADSENVTDTLATTENEKNLYESDNWQSRDNLIKFPDMISSNSQSRWMSNWNTDVFQLEREHGDNTLHFVAMEIMKERNLFKSLGLDQSKLSHYFQRIESKYNRSVCYHNSLHAVDVTLALNTILNTEAFQGGVFSDFEIFALLFAAIIHDVGHPGLTNQFLINTNNQLAILYNDISVLENHHLATAFSLMSFGNQDDDENVLQSFSVSHRQLFRKIVIDMVLATDMSKHMTMLADLKTTVETKKVSGIGILNLDNYNDRIQIMQNLLHCADLSNPTKPLQIYLQWTERVMEEFFQQGDREKELNIELSPMCDRENASIPQSQVSFIDFIVHPLWETWSELIQDGASQMLSNLAHNRTYYQNLITMDGIETK